MIYAFDVDGTLTPSRQPMDPGFKAWFATFVNTHRVILVTGSDYPKTVEQIGADLAQQVEKVYCCAGNSVWAQGQEVYRSDWTPSADLIKLLDWLENTCDYEHRYGNHIELRPGMVNFSVLGRLATHQQRRAYYQWDQQHQERVYVASRVKRAFPELDCQIGGEISVDIFPLGLDKSQIARQYTDTMMFFGDGIAPGKNDWPLAQALEYPSQAIPVSNWQETEKILKNQ